MSWGIVNLVVLQTCIFTAPEALRVPSATGGESGPHARAVSPGPSLQVLLCGQHVAVRRTYARQRLESFSMAGDEEQIIIATCPPIGINRTDAERLCLDPCRPV